MRNRTIETAATAIVVATLVFGMVLTMPSTPQYGEFDASTRAGRILRLSGGRVAA